MDHDDFAGFLASLRVACGTGQASIEVMRRALALAIDAIPEADRRALRDDHLRAAGDLLPAGLSAEGRASLLHREANRLRGAWHAVRYSTPDLGTARGHVMAALQLDERAHLGPRQLKRILGHRRAACPMVVPHTQLSEADPA